MTERMVRRSLVSQRVRNLAPSPIRRFFELVESMPDAISLSVGEPDFITPWHAREAAIFALEKGFTHYTPNRGILELRQEIARYLASRFGVAYDPESEILVTVGVSEALDLGLRTLLDPGDGAIIPEPCYVSYRPNTELVGGTPLGVVTREEDAFRVTPAAIAEVADRPSGDPEGRPQDGPRGRAKVLLLGYPSNPTGAVLGREDLAAIAEVVEARDLIVIADELYAELTYDGDHVSFASMPRMRERTVLLSGFSKGFAMTGWRLGFAAGPAEIIAAMTKIHGYTMLSAPGVAQKAAVESLRYGLKEVERMRREYDQRRHVVLKRLREMGLPCFEPRGAFYVFPSIRGAGLSSEDFAERLLLEEKVAVVPGNAFGACGEGHIRICYATAMADLQEAMARMARFVGRR